MSLKEMLEEILKNVRKLPAITREEQDLKSNTVCMIIKAIDYLKAKDTC